MLTLATLLLACSAATDPTPRTPAGAPTPPAGSGATPAAGEGAALPGPAAAAAPAGPRVPTDTELGLVADLERERADGGPPSEPLVARRRGVEVAEVEAAEAVVRTYRAFLAEEARAGLKRIARGAPSDGTYSLPNSTVGFTGMTGSDVGPYTAGLLIMVRACQTDADFATRLEKAVQDPIAALPAEASGYVARLGFNDEWSCTGWLDRQASYDRARNTVDVR